MITQWSRCLTMASAVLAAGCTSYGGGSASGEPAGPGYLPAGTPDISLSAGLTPDSVDYPVLFGTSRKPLPDGTGFSEDRDSSLHYGRIWITVPKNHKRGSLGSELGTIFQYDPKLTIARLEHVGDESQFLSLAARVLPPATKPENGYVIVFIHGFNNSFEVAAIRAAQLGIDLGVPQNDMFLFSWAARSSIPRYTQDEATVDASELFLRRFLETTAQAAGNRKIHLVAHSMGNRALMRVIAASVTGVARERGLRFGQIILAAADIDRDFFAEFAPNYLKVSDRTTVYLSPYDYAIGLSDIVHDYPRVGCGSSPQVVIPGIDSVVSTIPSDFPGHAYFAGSLPVLTDVKNLILRNQPARQGKDWTKAGDYWIVGGPIDKTKLACPG